MNKAKNGGWNMAGNVPYDLNQDGRIGAYGKGKHTV